MLRRISAYAVTWGPAGGITSDVEKESMEALIVRGKTLLSIRHGLRQRT
jgi:hypothetical protein